MVRKLCFSKNSRSLSLLALQRNENGRWGDLSNQNITWGLKTCVPNDFRDEMNKPNDRTRNGTPLPSYFPGIQLDNFVFSPVFRQTGGCQKFYLCYQSFALDNLHKI